MTCFNLQQAYQTKNGVGDALSILSNFNEFKKNVMASRVMTHFHTTIPFPQTKRFCTISFSTANVLTSYDTFRPLQPRPCYNTLTYSNHHHFVSHSEGADTQRDAIRIASP